MADTVLTSLTGLSTPAAADSLYIVDASVTDDSASGSSRKITYSNLVGGASATELGYVSGVTSALQTQIDLKAPLASPTFTGTVTMPVGLTGVLRADTGVVSVDSDITDLVSAASATVAGKVELATTAETTTGTDATRAVTPDGLHDMTSLSGAAWLKDEDDMSSDSATTVPSQQSVKAYVDTGTVTMTNKRITKRITTIVSSATPTVNTDNCDCVTITALAAAITSMTTNLSGTPTNFQSLIYRILDDGTGRAITWGASFQAMGVDLPTTTTASKVLTVGFLYDSVDSKWGCVAVSDEA